jgi:hypothetical protein
MTGLENLPVELVQIIYANLDVRSGVRLSCTCSYLDNCFIFSRNCIRQLPAKRLSDFFSDGTEFLQILDRTQSVVFGLFVASMVADVPLIPKRLDLAVQPDNEHHIQQYLNQEDYSYTERVYQYDNGMKTTDQFYKCQHGDQQVVLYQSNSTPFLTVLSHMDYSIEMCLMTGNKVYCLCPSDILENKLIRPLESARTYGKGRKLEELSNIGFRHIQWSSNYGPGFARKRRVGDPLNGLFSAASEGHKTGGNNHGFIQPKMLCSGSQNLDILDPYVFWDISSLAMNACYVVYSIVASFVSTSHSIAAQRPVIIISVLKATCRRSDTWQYWDACRNP